MMRNKSDDQTVTIDIYDQSLTAKEMRSIKQQVEKDVKLLRNRVRMLEMEHNRANKKI